MKVDYEACDLCGEPIEYDNGVLEIKCKQRWALGPESGKSRITLYICSNCQERLKRMFQRNRRIHGQRH